MTREEMKLLLDKGETDWLEWKADFPPQLVYKKRSSPDWEEGKGTLLKDLVSLANCRGCSPAYLVYGVKDLRTRRQVNGIRKSFDDADIQQWAQTTFDPIPEFQYEEVAFSESKTIGIIQIKKTEIFPSVVKQDVGKVLYKGQVWFRSGTRNDIALHADLKRLFREDKPIQFSRLHDAALKKIVKHYRDIGRTVKFPLIEQRELLLAKGYELATYPGTHREIVVGDGTPEHIALLEPSGIKKDCHRESE